MYPNVKTGLKKLYLAEILTIVSGLSVSFNGRDGKIIGIALGALGFLAYFISYRGLKQCGLEEKGYVTARTVSRIGFWGGICLTGVNIFLESPLLGMSTNEIQNLFNFLLAYLVVKTTADLLHRIGNHEEAVFGERLKKLYTLIFVITEVLGIAVDVGARVAEHTIFPLLAVIDVILLFMTQIRYMRFLGKTYRAL